MSRRLISILISGLAIVFAFGALTAIRWPSIMMFLTIFFHPDPALGFDNINWRELGFAYGAPYFLASLCFYAASISVARKGDGAIIWYVMGMVAATPVFFLVDFEEGWWRNASTPEGAVAAGSVIVVMLGLAVLNLRSRPVASIEAALEEDAETVTLSKDQFEALMASREARTEAAPAPVKPRIYRPVPAAIACQRAHFAAQGRRMRGRRGG